MVWGDRPGRMGRSMKGIGLRTVLSGMESTNMPMGICTKASFQRTKLMEKAYIVEPREQ